MTGGVRERALCAGGGAGIRPGPTALSMGVLEESDLLVQHVEQLVVGDRVERVVVLVPGAAGVVAVRVLPAAQQRFQAGGDARAGTGVGLGGGEALVESVEHAQQGFGGVLFLRSVVDQSVEVRRDRAGVRVVEDEAGGEAETGGAAEPAAEFDGGQ